MIVSERIQAIRRYRRLQGKELADLAGVSPAEITLIEQRQRKPQLETLQRLAAALDVSVGFLIGEEDDDCPLLTALSRQSLKVFLRRNTISDENRKLMQIIVHLSSAPKSEQEWKDFLSNFLFVTQPATRT
jgi:transcriptional regulator with XRE-family HTH domain